VAHWRFKNYLRPQKGPKIRENVREAQSNGEKPLLTLPSAAKNGKGLSPLLISKNYE
jgi:hypothetical protein